MKRGFENLMDEKHHNFSSESVKGLYPLIQVSWLMQ